MKPPHILCVVSLVLVALGISGCATSFRSARATQLNRPRSFALAVTVHGALQPTPAQFAAIQAKVAQSLAGRGWVLVTDIGLADHILRVDFTPNPNDPENSGHAQLLAIRRNPLSTVARQGMSPYPTAFGYSGYQNTSWWNSSLYSGRYYGYGDFYNEGYSPGWYTTPVTTPPVCPPLRNPPGNREDCLPGFGVRPLPGVFAGNLAPGTINDHPRPPPRDYGRWSGERVAARSDRSERSYSRSDYSNSRSDSYFSRSDSSYSRSEPSYSQSSYSSSDSYSASASSSASSSAAASSAASSSEPVVVSSGP
jgi:hypothetical protein